MNLNSSKSFISRALFTIAIGIKGLLPKKKSTAFGRSHTGLPKIEKVYVINLNRQKNRLKKIEKELRAVLDYSGDEIWNITERFEAIDGSKISSYPNKNEDLDPVYNLRDQLFVEPQPLALPTKVDLKSPIQMSRPEIAVAHSHIEVWKRIRKSNCDYALILEDDVWFSHRMAQDLDRAWSEIIDEYKGKPEFDVFYLSYKEVKGGAPKTFISKNVFRPEKGLWYLSGYVVSRKGTEKLLSFLPCKGPVDLWINHQFQLLDVIASRTSIIQQRRDMGSTNSYSVLPSLTKVGVINSESQSLFNIRPIVRPVFVFGPENSGLSSLAMALSMLGYRCCSDLHELPENELKFLKEGNGSSNFNAYVNIGSLEKDILHLIEKYPQAKFIITEITSPLTNKNILGIVDALDESQFTFLKLDESNKWDVICELLRCAPPPCAFPEVSDLGKRVTISNVEKFENLNFKDLKWDQSPWVMETTKQWDGIELIQEESLPSENEIFISDSLKALNSNYWFRRDDTFTDNLALFRESNFKLLPGLGASLSIRKEDLGVRKFSAAAITSKSSFLYGKFEVILKASDAPGVVTGFFLHRNSPRQEIDMEITGNRTDKLLVNVFYNPGQEEAKFDYGYRGTPTLINLGFDASKSFHKYSIHWRSNEIQWFVDDNLVYKRVQWDPTPIPHLPMEFHLNIWPTRSKELAGRLKKYHLPTSTVLKLIELDANVSNN